MGDSSKATPAADIGKQQIGAVYAKAALGATGKSGGPEAFVDDLETFVNEVLGPYPEFEKVLSSPRVSVDEKQELLDRVFGGRLSESLLTFLKVVCQHGRLDCLRDIQVQARLQLDQSLGVVDAEVITAEAIDKSLRQRIEESLNKAFDRKVRVHAQVDPSLVGGMVVRVRSAATLATGRCFSQGATPVRQRRELWRSTQGAINQS